MRSDRRKITQHSGGARRQRVQVHAAGRDSCRASRSAATGSIYTVEDTGIGIPADAQRYVFDEFRQVDGTLTRAVRRFGTWDWRWRGGWPACSAGRSRSSRRRPGRVDVHGRSAARVRPAGVVSRNGLTMINEMPSSSQTMQETTTTLAAPKCSRAPRRSFPIAAVALRRRSSTRKATGFASFRGQGGEEIVDRRGAAATTAARA